MLAPKWRIRDWYDQKLLWSEALNQLLMCGSLWSISVFDAQNLIKWFWWHIRDFSIEFFLVQLRVTNLNNYFDLVLSVKFFSLCLFAQLWAILTWDIKSIKIKPWLRESLWTSANVSKFMKLCFKIHCTYMTLMVKKRFKQSYEKYLILFMEKDYMSLKLKKEQYNWKLLKQKKLL